MGKLILLSILVMTGVIPIWMSTRPAGRRALKRAQWSMAIFIALWAIACVLFYPALVPLK